MRRFIALVLVLVLAPLLLLVVSCGEHAPGAARSLTVAVAVLPTERDAYRKVLDRFQAEHACTIELVAQQYGEIRRSVQAEAQAGGGELDLVEMDVFYLEATRPLMSEIAVGADVAALLNKSAMEAGRFDGRQIFLPHRLGWQALIYDARKIPRPPTTWAELESAAKANTGRIGLKAAPYEGLACDALPFIWQGGGDPLQPERPETLEALRFLARLAPHLNPQSRSYKEGSALEALEHEEIVMHLNWPFVVPQLAAKGLLPGKFKVAPLPAGPGGAATVLGGGYLGIPRTSKNASLARELALHLVSVRAQQELVGGLGWFPVRPEGWDAFGERERALYRGFIEMQDAVRARPRVAYYEELSAAWQTAIRALLFDRSTPEAAAAAVAARLAVLAKR